MKSESVSNLTGTTDISVGELGGILRALPNEGMRDKKKVILSLERKF